MTDERDILDELGALLDVEPSAAFAAHVRHAIEHDAPRRFSWRVTILVGLGVAAAGLVLALVVRRSALQTPPAARISSSAAPVRESPAAGVQPHESSRQTHEHSAAPRARAVAEPLVDLAPIVTTVDGVEAIVPADQRLALARLVSGVRAGRFRVPAGWTPKYDADGLLLPLAPVAMSAIPDPVPAPIDPPATVGDPRGSRREQ